jgi:hypothetical protein
MYGAVGANYHSRLCGAYNSCVAAYAALLLFALFAAYAGDSIVGANRHKRT